MSSLASRSGAGEARGERRVADRAGAGRRLARQMGIVLRREIPLSLYLLLLGLATLPWVFRLDDGWILWVTIDRDLAMFAFFLSIVASVVAFMVGQRDARNAITELQGSTVASRRDVVLARMVAMVLVGWLALAVLVAGTYTVGALHATWGRPDLRLLIPLALWSMVTIPLLVVLGDRSARIEQVRPLMWLVAVAVVTWFAHLAGWFPFVASLMDAMSWPGPPPGTVPDPNNPGQEAIGAAWPWLLAGALLLALARLALPDRFDDSVSPGRWMGAAGATLALASVVAVTGLGAGPAGAFPSRAVAGPLDACVEGIGYRACGHPAYAGMIEAHRDDIKAVLSVIDGVDVLPVEIVFLPVDRMQAYTRGMPDLARDTAIVLPTQPEGFAGSDAFRQQLVQQVFTIRGAYVNDSTVADVVRAWWLLELGFTPEDTPQLAIWMGDDTDFPGGFVPPDLSPHVERFAALPDDERIAWLDANWDALRAGDLILEDLP